MKNAPKQLKTGLIGISAALSMLAMPAAQATLLDGIVDIWTVGVAGEFLEASILPAAGVTFVNDQSLRWGTPATDGGQSGLDITNLAPANVNTNGAAVANTSVTHLNQPIFAPSLQSVVLRSALTLTPFSPGGAALPSVSIDFLIDFLETDNGANPCADGGANGVGVNSNGCADIFVIDQAALNFPFFYDLDGAGGPLQNQQYFISFFELTSGLNPLPVDACNAVLGADEDVCLGFRTPEGDNTTFQFAALITTERVSIPEPGALALMGLGIGLMGMLHRRRRTA